MKEIITIIDAISNVHKDSMIQICDINYKFRFVGEKFADLLQISSKKIINKNLSEINCPIQRIAYQYRLLHDPLILSRAKEAHYITYYNYMNRLYIVENKVTPIVLNGKVLGIFIDSNHTDELSKINFDIINNLKDSKILNLKNYENNFSNITINFVEEIIIILLVMGYQDKEIANVLCQVGKCVSHHAVSKIITRNFFPKFNVTSRWQLIKKLYSHGFHKSLPKSLINNMNLLQTVFKPEFQENRNI